MKGGNTHSGGKKAKKLLFYFIMIFFVLFVFEWSGRLFVSWRDYKGEEGDFLLQLATMQVVDPDVGHFYRTDSPKTIRSYEFSNDYYFIDLGLDSLLFRDDGINTDRKKRLLALGDSYVWGWGVDLKDTFSEVLERMDSDLDVINAGMPAYTTKQYTDLLKKFVNSNVTPQGVIYNFYSGNDIIYEYSYREWKKFAQRFPDLTSPYYLRVNLISQKAVDFETAKRMARVADNKGRSGFVNFFLWQWLSSYRFSLRFGRFLAGKIDAVTAFDPWQGATPMDPEARKFYVFPARLTLKSPDGSLVTLYSELINAVAGESLSQDQRNFKAMYQLNLPLAIESIAEAKEICDSQGLRFWLVYVPAKEEIYADELCQRLSEPLRSQVRAKMNTAHDDVLRACRALGIDIIDLRDDCIRAEKEGLKLCYNIDPHFNKNGHRLWAEVVMKQLRKSWSDDKG